MSNKLEEGEFESEPLDGSDLKPMDVSASAANGGSLSDWATSWLNSKRTVPRKYKLVTDGNYRRNSMRSLQFAVLVSAISTKMLAPNCELRLLRVTSKRVLELCPRWFVSYDLML